MSGEAGVLEALRSLEGFEAPAVEWERNLLPARVAGYDPRWLDSLCLTGVIGWGRLSPHPAFFAAQTGADAGGPRRVIPTGMAPITFFVREEALWLDLCLTAGRVPEGNLPCCLSELALSIRACLAARGAMFAADLLRAFTATPAELDHALWELVAAGLVMADGFDSLRQLIDPRRKQLHAPSTNSKRAVRQVAGRWSLIENAATGMDQPWQKNTAPLERDAAREAGAIAERCDAQLASACRTLLRRYGLLFRDLLERETNMPKWRELLPVLRRMEARGEARGGRFLSGFAGEQFALPEALQSLREARRGGLRLDLDVTISAADPLNLLGTVIPGERVPAIAGRSLTWNHAALQSGQVRALESSGVPQQSPIFAAQAGLSQVPQ